MVDNPILNRFRADNAVLCGRKHNDIAFVMLLQSNLGYHGNEITTLKSRSPLGCYVVTPSQIFISEFDKYIGHQMQKYKAVVADS